MARSSCGNVWRWGVRVWWREGKRQKRLEKQRYPGRAIIGPAWARSRGIGADARPYLAPRPHARHGQRPSPTAHASDTAPACWITAPLACPLSSSRESLSPRPWTRPHLTARPHRSSCVWWPPRSPLQSSRCWWRL